MIHVENLTKYYNDYCAVDQISFDVKKGEILGLLGPNGAGKTTTLRMLTGYFLPSAGDITVNDYSIREHPLEIKSMMGYLPESAPLYHNMLVYDYLQYVAKVRGLKKNERIPRIKELSKLCGLGGIMHKSINELSKGLKQRVGLAHAMMSDPQILILDEPTSGLDPNQIVEIRDIIKQIGKEKTIIFSTHILSEAEATCDRLVIINKGRIAADDKTLNLKKTAGRNREIQLTLGNAGFLPVKDELGKITGVQGIENRGTDETGNIIVKVSCNDNDDVREPLYNSIKKTDWVLLEMKQEAGTLENIFRKLTLEA